MISGTATFPVEPVTLVRIASIAFAEDTLIVRLTDGRALYLEMQDYAWLSWLRQATPEQRSRWTIVPSGGGVWWLELDEGIELLHLLDPQPLVRINQSLRVNDGPAAGVSS